MMLEPSNHSTIPAMRPCTRGGGRKGDRPVRSYWHLLFSALMLLLVPSLVACTLGIDQPTSLFSTVVAPPTLYYPTPTAGPIPTPLTYPSPTAVIADASGTATLVLSLRTNTQHPPVVLHTGQLLHIVASGDDLEFHIEETPILTLETSNTNERLYRAVRPGMAILRIIVNPTCYKSDPPCLMSPALILVEVTVQ